MTTTLNGNVCTAYLRSEWLQGARDGETRSEGDRGRESA